MENTIIEIAGRIDRVESGKSSMSRSSVLRIFLHTVPIGQVEVG